MLLAQADSRRTGLRPFNPFRDLRGVASLLVRVFGDEMRMEPGGGSRSLAFAIRYPDLAWLWLGFDAWFDGSLYGFVWEEQGRIVGNANIAPLSESGHQWVMSNVAVEPEYRGRGIASALVGAAIDYATQNGATRLLLQVWNRNGVAVRLYHRYGMQVIGETTRLRLGPGVRTVPPAGCPEGVSWRQAQMRDRFELVAVANAMTTYEMQRLRSLGLRAFDDDDLLGPLLAHLGLGQERPRRLLVRGGRAVGGVALADRSGSGRVVVLLRPDEEKLLAACVAAEAASLGKRALGALCDVPGQMKALVADLQAVGFEHVDDLLHMALDLKRVA
jgi:ribosomal protein S18 acetylase RimI-like enzyme